MARSSSPQPLDASAASTGSATRSTLLASGSRPGPVGSVRAQAAPVGVRLVFLPSGAPASEAVPAANQHVYIDLTAGTVAHVQTNGQGRLVPVPPDSAPIVLDPARTYHVVAAPSALTVPPSAGQGVSVQLGGGQIAVPPQIAIKIVRNGTGVGNVACVLKIGAADTNLTSASTGWVISNDKSAGAVTIRCNTLSLQTAGATPPTVTLGLTPATPTRGDVATIAINAPAGTVGLKVREWKYDISHTNPGAATPSTASVTRPPGEAAPTFDQNWAGELCASGVARATFVLGAQVRASGDASVNVSLDAADPIAITLAVTVANRGGASWTTTLTENPVGSFTRAIRVFEDLGHHNWSGGPWAISAPHTVSAGPNRGCQFLTSASASFTSTPEINADLVNPASAFSQAQNKAYLTSPAPVRVIPRSAYTIGPQGAVNETSPGSIGAALGITGAYRISDHCIDQGRLLAGTRRHESEDPPPAAKSHKGNCLKALRALEPVKFVEAMVGLPGRAVDFRGPMQSRVTAIGGVAATHSVVDEAQTAANGRVVFTGDSILAVNADSSGAMIGPAWNPTTNSQLSN